MRLVSLRVHGIGPAFRSTEAFLDLSAIPGRLLAFVAANGAGKSSFAGSFAGALYRDVPTRGSLVDMARAAGCRDAFIEAVIETPRRLTIRHSIDGVSEKSEATITDENGAPVLTSTSVRAFDAWIAQNLPSREVFLSTSFVEQGGSGWLGLSAADRRGVVLRAIGADGYERRSAAALKKASEVRSTLDAAQIRLADAKARAVPVPTAESAVFDAVTQRLRADHELTAAQSDLERVRSQHTTLLAAFNDAEAARIRRVSALAAMIEARARLDNLQARAAKQRAALADAPAIRAAVDQLPKDATARDEADVRLREAQDLVKATSATIAEQDRVAKDADERAGRAAKDGTPAQAAADELGRARTTAGNVEKSAADLVTAQASEVAAEAAVVETQAEIDRLRDSTLDVSEKRCVSLRDAIDEIRTDDSGEDARPRAQDAAEYDDAMERAAADAPTKLVTARSEKTLRDKAALAARAERCRAQAVADAVRTASSRIPDLERAADPLAEHRAAESSARADFRAARARRDEENKRLTMQLVAETNAATARSDAGKVLEITRTVAARAPSIAAAEAALSEIQGSSSDREKAVTQAQSELDRCPEVPTSVPAPPDVSKHEAAVAAAETASKDAAARVAVAESRLVEARETSVRIAGMEMEAQAMAVRLADFNLLAEALGQRGLIAMTVDACGPEWGASATDLLRSCYGTRWTVTIRTAEAKADGSGDKEVCQAMVLDTEDGTEVEFEHKSPGQQAPIGEAISLALMMIACRRSGVKNPTLVRDETDAAINHAQAPAYVAMLRRAMDIVGADKLLLITHNPETISLCDSRIRIADGLVSIEQE